MQMLQWLSQRCFSGDSGRSAKSAKALFIRMFSAQGILILQILRFHVFIFVSFNGVCLKNGCNNVFPINSFQHGTILLSNMAICIFQFFFLVILHIQNAMVFPVGIVQYSIGGRRHRRTWQKLNCNQTAGISEIFLGWYIVLFTLIDLLNSVHWL